MLILVCNMWAILPTNICSLGSPLKPVMELYCINSPFLLWVFKLSIFKNFFYISNSNIFKSVLCKSDIFLKKSPLIWVPIWPPSLKGGHLHMLPFPVRGLIPTGEFPLSAEQNWLRDRMKQTKWSYLLSFSCDYSQVFCSTVLLKFLKWTLELLRVDFLYGELSNYLCWGWRSPFCWCHSG